jgi:hypothetical protein
MGISKEAPYGYDTNGAIHTEETARMEVKSNGHHAIPTAEDIEEAKERLGMNRPIGQPNPMSDDKGRPALMYMTDRELFEEIVTSQRQLSDLVEGFMSSMDKNPMMKMFAGKMGGKG